jgi:hypothetical protein
MANFDVSGSVAWVNGNNQDLVSKASLEAITAKMIPTKITNCKYKSYVNYMETDAYFQAQITCPSSILYGSGTTAMLNKEISVVNLTVADNLSPESLNHYNTQLSLKPGYNKELPFAAYYCTEKVLKIQEGIEKMIWSSTVASSQKFSGLKYLFDNDADVLDSTIYLSASGSTYTAAQWNTLIKGMLGQLPTEIQFRDDMTLFMNPLHYNMLCNALFMNNFYNFNNTESKKSFKYPSLPITVVETPGITGNFMALTPLMNLIWACDLDNEESKFNLEYSNRCVTFTADMKLGVNYFWGAYVALAQ